MMTDSKVPNRSLLFGRLAPVTVKSYKRALIVFLQWCLDHSLEFGDAGELRECLLDWIHEVYAEQSEGSRDTCLKAYSALIYLLPSLKMDLVDVSRALKNWGKERPSTPWPPMTWQLAVAVAMRMALSAGARPAIATLLAWEGLLRAGEVLNLRKEDVLDPVGGDLRVGAGTFTMTLRIAKAKTGKNQSVEIVNDQVQKLVRSVVAALEPGEKLFPFSHRWWLGLFKTACEEYEIKTKYVLHSLRHGKATHLYMMTKDVAHVMMMGRWAVSKTAIHYIQQGPALLAQLQAPKEVAEYGGNASLQLCRVLDWACATREKALAH
jgi:integrase